MVLLDFLTGVGLQVSLANLGVGQILKKKYGGPAVNNLTP